MRLTRTEVQRVACPACGAPPKEPCNGSRGEVRVANHLERVRAAEKWVQAFIDHSDDPDPLPSAA